MAEGRPTRLPILTEILRGRRRDHRRGSLENHGTSSPVNFELESPSSTSGGIIQSPYQEILDHNDARHFIPGTLKIGDLIKVSKSRSNDKIHGPPRKRRFRVSEEAIEYFQLFSHIKVKKSFPITSIIEVKHVEGNPSAFQLVFKNFLMELEAASPAEASDWVRVIQKCVTDWQEDDPTMSIDQQAAYIKNLDDEEVVFDPEGLPSIPERSNEDGTLDSPADGYVEPQNLPITDIEKDKTVIREKSVRPFSPRRTRSQTVGEMLKTWSTEDDLGTGTYGFKRNKRRQSVGRKLHLAPKLQKHNPITAFISNEEEECWKVLHDDFAMIKYPRTRWGSIPTEKIFQLDKDNLQIMWKKTANSRTKFSSTLRLDSILEVRLGQQTDGFEKFPYEEVTDQSFSLIYEDLNGKYAKLGSLDLVCDHPFHFAKWVEGLRALQIGPVTAMFPTRYENTDPVLVWLKRFWTCYSANHELCEKDSIRLMKLMNPGVSRESLQPFLNTAHTHQHEASIGNGKSLRWDGLVLLYNLLVGETGRLNSIYRDYAKTYKRLGMTIEEFKEFLIKECHYKEEDCYRRRLKELISFHDHHHLAFKKFIGNNKPSNWKTAVKLLSYAGFLSFLRSKHNAAVNPLHDTIYQDMEQPLSHYFINSSHNTYLEADQIKGRSTLDAYVRALLQGCRCVEIDCWDGNNGEPIIYHGFTFTSKLPLRDVIRTINKYAFQMSLYPVIISIENHCNQQQQAKMAQIFNEEFQNECGQCIVATTNLCENNLSCRRRLPSPTELQGLILLKGSYKIQTPKARKAFSQVSPSLPRTPQKRYSEDDYEVGPSDGELTEPSPTGKGQWEWPSPDSVDKGENEGGENSKPINKGSVVLTRGRTRREAKRFSARVKESNGNVETPEDDQELSYIETTKDLRDMIVYCRSTRIKPWSWKEQKRTSICQMFSFGEISAYNHYKKSPRELLACTERQFVRTYPKGARIDSSNYNPLPFWNHGIQMAALNFQTPDIHMHLNQGRFRQNGGCGYVLKPEIMRRANPGSGEFPFDPLMEWAHPLIPTCKLDIELLSGQNLTILGKTCISLSVQISTHGIAADNHSMIQADCSDVLHPNWPSGHKSYSVTILMPELCLVYFRVDVSVKTAGRNVTQIAGQNCIALPSLQPGIKFIQLRKNGGELIPESGLYVKIKMDWDRPPSSSSAPLSPLSPARSSITSCETPPISLTIDAKSKVKKRRSNLVHQQEIDVTQTLSPENIRALSNDRTEAYDKSPKEFSDDSSLVNLLDINTKHKADIDNERVGPGEERDTMEVTAEFY